MDEARFPLSKYPFVLVRVGCLYCSRRGEYRLARPASKYGAEIELDALIDILASDCRWHRGFGARRPGKYDAKCGAYFPDIGRPLPPDLPPVMLKLRVVNGGKG